MAFIGIIAVNYPEGLRIRRTPQSHPFGPFVNQHHFAAFMELTAGCTTGLMFENHCPRQKLLLLMALMAARIVSLTSSRGGVIGFASMLAFVVLVNLSPASVR